MKNVFQNAKMPLVKAKKVWYLTSGTWSKLSPLYSNNIKGEQLTKLKPNKGD